MCNAVRGVKRWDTDGENIIKDNKIQRWVCGSVEVAYLMSVVVLPDIDVSKSRQVSAKGDEEGDIDGVLAACVPSSRCSQ